MTRRRPCPAARLIAAELAADIAQRRYDRTRSDQARIALKAARLACLALMQESTRRARGGGR
jgi:hypothetical protein